jgi:tetratricopeptide (TPR) repeat protein
MYLSAIYKLNKMYWDLEKMTKAENLVQQAPQGYCEILDPDDAVTLDALNALATNLAQQGRLAEAEKKYVRVLEGKRKTLIPTNSSTLDTVNILAALYIEQGRAAEAANMHIDTPREYEQT